MFVLLPEMIFSFRALQNIVLVILRNTLLISFLWPVWCLWIYHLRKRASVSRWILCASPARWAISWDHINVFSSWKSPNLHRHVYNSHVLCCRWTTVSSEQPPLIGSSPAVISTVVICKKVELFFNYWISLIFYPHLSCLWYIFIFLWWIFNVLSY